MRDLASNVMKQEWIKIAGLYLLVVLIVCSFIPYFVGVSNERELFPKGVPVGLKVRERRNAGDFAWLVLDSDKNSQGRAQLAASEGWEEQRSDVPILRETSIESFGPVLEQLNIREPEISGIYTRDRDDGTMHAGFVVGPRLVVAVFRP